MNGNHRYQSLFCRFAAMCVFSWACASNCIGQKEESGPNAVPYRRVFVPSKDVDSFGLDGFRPIEIKRLETLLQKYQKAIEPEGGGDASTENVGRVRLQSAYYVAKLVGADLLSERSRLTLVGTSNVGERLSLKPWSLAIQPIGASDLRSESESAPNWIFDLRGMPRIAADPLPVAEGVAKNRDGESSYTFGWSTRADAESTPNKLRFSMDLPKCPNSCLVLSLPPEAVVHDCATVARRLIDWSEVGARLSDWSDLAGRNSSELGSAGSSESLWLIELGGSSLASFTISLGDSRGTQVVQQYQQMIRSQTIEHFVKSAEILSFCEAEVMASPEPSMLRMRLANGAKLRRLTVNQQEVDWKFDGEWIQWNQKYLVPGNSSGYSIVNAEFISALTVHGQQLVETPIVDFEHAYVMSGTTVLHTESPWRLAEAKCDGHRIVKSNGPAREAELNRLEHSWFAHPPGLFIRLEPVNRSRKCEALTRVSNDEHRTTAVIRARLFFNEQDTNQVNLRVGLGWMVRSVKSVDANDEVKLQWDAEDQLDAQSASAVRGLRVGWDRIQKNRIGEIEIELVREAEAGLGKKRNLQQQTLLEFLGWTLGNTLILEDNESYGLNPSVELIDSMISNDVLAPWKTPLLPKERDYYALRLATLASSYGSGSIVLPNLIWDPKEISHQANVSTVIERVSSNALRSRHEMKLTFCLNRIEPLTIQLRADQVYWRLKRGDELLPFSPSDDSPAHTDSESGLWRFDIRNLDAECSIVATVSTETKDEEETLLPLPKLINAETQSHEVRCLDSDVEIRGEEGASNWRVDDMGYGFLQILNVNTVQGLAVKIEAKRSPKTMLVTQYELHLGVDSIGLQKACIQLRTSSFPMRPIAIELEKGWEPSAVVVVSEQVRRDIPFRLDGSRIIVSPEAKEFVGEIEIQIQLAGPQLPKTFSVSNLASSFIFEWPSFPINAASMSNRRLLWLPKANHIAETVAPTKDSVDSTWSMWKWSRNVVMSLISSSTSIGPPTASDRTRSSGCLFPIWEADEWRVALESPIFIESTLGARTKSVETLAIESIGSNGSMLAMVFVLTILLTPKLLMVRYSASAIVAATLILVSHLAPDGPARFAYTALIGMSVGFAASVLYRLMFRSSSSDGSASKMQSAKWAPWNEHASENDFGLGKKVMQQSNLKSAASNLGSLCIAFVFGWGFVDGIDPANAYGYQSSEGQESIVTRSSDVYQIIIPMDEDGNMAGTVAYAPSELLTELNGGSDTKRFMDRGTHPISAKYNLRIGSLGRFSNSVDQISMVLDFWVGEDLSPVRFPINGTQLLLPRFSVDGEELNLGSKLRSNGFEWTWNPEKSGRHTVKIVSQPVLKSIDSDRNRDSQTKQLDLSLIPVANALIEIETEPSNGIEVLSRGRVTDPTPGRFVAMLGAVDRLQCNVIIPKPTIAPPVFPINGSDNNEQPIMHFELLLQNNMLQGRTIVEFPKGAAYGPEVEMEADLQWQPVGTVWGDAEWVETRPGSTLARRRYLLRWKDYPKSGNPSPISNRDRQISVVWVPTTEGQSLNVLFAECRDRRTRRGALRYSRAAGASWTIEGVGSWIPAIDSKERLDWPELKSKPFATSLRIPINGGFGILKPETLNSERPQARVTSKWVVETNRESLSSRVELFGGESNSEPFMISLPKGFVLTELFNSSGPIPYLQSSTEGMNQVQVLADQRTLEVSDLWIQAIGEKLELEARFDKGKLHEVPWIALPARVSSDQSMEVYASESIAIQWGSEPSILTGKGQLLPVAKLAKLHSNIDSIASGSQEYRLLERNQPPKGEITLKAGGNSGLREIEMVGLVSQSITSTPFFVLAIPASLKDRWQSESRVQVVPCSVSDRALLKVYFPESFVNESDTSANVLIRFLPKADDPQSDAELMKQVFALDKDRITTTILKASIALEDSHKVVPPIAGDSQKDQLQIAQLFLQVNKTTNGSTMGSGEVWSEAVYWIEPGIAPRDIDGKLEWQVADSVEVSSVELNGRPLAFERDLGKVSCMVPELGLHQEVKFFLKHRTYENAGVGSIEVPYLIGYDVKIHIALNERAGVAVKYAGIAISSTSRLQMLRSGTELSLSALEDGSRQWPNLAAVERGSDLDQWKRHWFQRAQRCLAEWANLTDFDEENSFGQATRRWHYLMTTLHHNRLPDSSDPRTSGLFSLPADEEFPSTVGVAATSPKWLRVQSWYSLVGCLIALVGLVSVSHSFGNVLFERPWWCFMAMGAFAWLICGSVMLAVTLGTIGLIVAADSYWIVTSRLRRIGIRGPRSL